MLLNFSYNLQTFLIVIAIYTLSLLEFKEMLTMMNDDSEGWKGYMVWFIIREYQPYPREWLMLLAHNFVEFCMQLCGSWHMDGHE